MLILIQPCRCLLHSDSSFIVCIGFSLRSLSSYIASFLSFDNLICCFISSCSSSRFFPYDVQFCWHHFELHCLHRHQFSLLLQRCILKTQPQCVFFQLNLPYGETLKNLAQQGLIASQNKCFFHSDLKKSMIWRALV